MNKNIITLALALSLTACGSDEIQSQIEAAIDNNNSAEIAGDLVAAAAAGESTTLTGSLSIDDADAGESIFVAQDNVSTKYGAFSLTAQGDWTYTYDPAGSDYISDSSSEDDDGVVTYVETLVEMILIKSADSTREVLEITIPALAAPAEEEPPVIVPPVVECTPAEIMGVGGLAFATDNNLAAEFAKDKYPAQVWNDDLDSGWTGSTSRESDGVTDKAISGEVSAVFKLADISTVSQLNLLWDKGNTRTTNYKVQTAKVYSDDDSTWTEVLAQGDSTQLEAEGFEAVTVTETDAEYIRITGYQNSGGSGWISLNEMEVIGCASDETSMAVNVLATFGGATTGGLDNDEDSASGTLTALDLDGDMIVAQAKATTTLGYGDFEIDAAGAWIYTLNKDDSMVSSLAADVELVDTVTVAAEDGATTNVTITITGAAAPVVAPVTLVVDELDTYTADEQIDTANSDYVTTADGTTLIAKISTDQAESGVNSLYLEDQSTGGKSIVSRAFEDGAADSGTVSVSAYIPAAGYVKSTYIYLGEVAGNSDSGNRFTEVVFSSSSVKFRNESGSQKTLTSYTPDTWVDVEISWVGTAVTVTIDGVEFTSYDDSGTAVPLVAENRMSSGPKVLTVYAGDNSTVGTYSYIDNIASNLFEQPVSAITDDFESYTADVQIDTANSDYVTTADGSTLIAKVSTAQANSGTNSVYLEDQSTGGKSIVSRAFTAGVADSGSVSVSAYVPAAGYVKSTYIYLGEVAGNSDSGNRFTEVVFSSSSVKFRNESGSQKTITSYTPDTWVDVTISWVGTAVTLTIDGVDYTTYDDSGTAVPLVAENRMSTGPKVLTVYAGDNSTVGTYSFFDNINSALFD